MPTYRVTDPDTGITLRLTGDSPPTEQELEQIFAAQQPAQQQPASRMQPPGSVGELLSGAGRAILGTPEAGLSLASSAIAEPVAGLAGLAQSLNPLAAPGAGARTVESVREALTFEPRTGPGREAVEGMGTALAPVGRAIQGAEEALGGGTLEATGSPLLATGAAMAPAAALEVLGLKGVSSINASRRRMAASKNDLVRRMQAGSTDADIAKLDLVETDGTPKIVKDVKARETIRQGFDEGVISPIKRANRPTKDSMLRALAIMETGKKNRVFALKNRPSDVAGNILAQRYDAIKTANKEAGKAINEIAENQLRDKPIDVSGPVEQFGVGLDEFGVRLVDDGKGGLRPDFADSSIAPGDRRPLIEVIRQMNRLNKVIGQRGTGAFEAHQLKRIIDDNVTFGKKITGLGARTEILLKNFRRGLDEQLDTAFPAYNDANTKFAATRSASESLENVARSLDFESPKKDKSIGTLLRRVMGNATSRVRLLDAIDEVENTYKQFGGSKNLRIEGPSLGSDDLMTQILFVDELDRVFGPVARTSLEGEVGRSTERALRAAASRAGFAEEIIRGAGKLAERARGINEENAIESMRELLSEGRNAN